MKRLNIVDPKSPDFCCGSLCPKKEVQARIDDMQNLIDELSVMVDCWDFKFTLGLELVSRIKELSSDK